MEINFTLRLGFKYFKILYVLLLLYIYDEEMIIT